MCMEISSTVCMCVEISECVWRLVLPCVCVEISECV